MEIQLDDYLEFQFSTQTPSTGAATDADSLPTYRVYEAGNDTVVASGNCSKVDDANTTGYYRARAQVATGTYTVGTVYLVQVAATVGAVDGEANVGEFIVVPADVARDDQWTDTRAGLLTTNLDAAVSTRGTADPGDEMDLVPAPNVTAVAAIQAGIALEATLTAIKGATFATGTDSLEAIRNRGDAAWTTGGSGGGVNTVTLTYTDDDSNVVAGLKITCKNVAEDTTVATVATNSLGIAVFALDDATYHFLSPSTPIYDLTNNTKAVSGTTTASYEVTTTAIPSPSDATLCRVYAYMREIEGGTVLGADEGTLNVVALRSRPSGATIIYGDGVAARGTDTNGFVYVDIVRGATVQLRGTWTGTTARTEDVEVVVPDSATYNVGVLFEV